MKLATATTSCITAETSGDFLHSKVFMVQKTVDDLDIGIALLDSCIPKHCRNAVSA